MMSAYDYPGPLRPDPWATSWHNSLLEAEWVAGVFRERSEAMMVRMEGRILVAEELARRIEAI